MLKIEIFSDRKEVLGEGPLWDVEEQRLYWIDSYGSAVHCADAKGGDQKSWTLPEPVGSMAMRERGGAVVSLRSGFHFLDFDTGMVCSNGPCWSPDGKIFYFTDTYSRMIWTYDYDIGTGEVRSRRNFASFEKVGGFPDGATVDSEGYVWSVAVYAGRLVRFDPNGVIDRIVGLPVFSATSVTFGGPDLDIAYITSMARPFNGEYHREREAGMTFAVYGLGVRGLPEPRFKG